MTEQLRRLMIRQSEIREKINRLAAVAEPSDTQTADLDAARREYGEVETEYRSALASDGETTGADGGEDRERRELRERSRVHRYVEAAINGTAVDGAEAECSSAYGCAGRIPLEMLAPETRAITPAPATGTPQNTSTILPAVFDRGAAAYLGVEMPTVAAGTAAYPVITTSVTAGARAKGAAAPETAGAITPYLVTPRRISGSFRVAAEDAAMLPDLESAFRDNLGAVLSDQVDKQVISGDNVAPNLNGITTQLTAATAPAAGVETFDRYVLAAASHVDGLYAYTLADVRLLVGPQTYRHAAATFRGTDGETAAQSYLASATGGFRASRRIPDPASKVQTAVVRRAAPGRAAVAPVWEGVQLIRDPYTGAGKGETVLTVLLLIGGVAILRPSAFVADSFRLVA